MIKRFYELQEKILGYYPDADIELLKKAYTIATDAHLNQKRATDEPYMVHPLSVAEILSDMRLDETSIAAGLLHDVLEDSPYTQEELSKLFGKEISDIVWGVTKITKISSNLDVENAKAETLKKMIMAMVSDIRVIMIKLADRLHNLRTLDPLGEEKKKKIARETLDIYAPIAYRLGMGKIKDELEDQAFKYLYPKEYQHIQAEISGKTEWAEAQLAWLEGEIRKILAEYRIPAEITHRIKREISIFRKLERQNIDLDQVFDLLALRIITNTVASCYSIAGAIHQKWAHIPSRWRDFIAAPKSNHYQALHTTIITPEGVKFEIQIRSQDMHRTAEEGIAAHWRYKEGLSFIENDNRLEWFRELIEQHRSNPDPREFLSLVKKDLAPNEIYVFTPKGKVVMLKAGASPIDFAYAIHSDIGDHCKSAIVNENIVPLKSKLNSGDVIQIITNKENYPNIEWLKYVTTTRARKKILGYLQKKETQLNLEKGRRIWQKVWRDIQKKYKISSNDEELQKRIAAGHYPDMDSFFKDIGSGRKVLDRHMLTALFPEAKIGSSKPRGKKTKRVASQSPLINVEGLQGIDFALAKCCNPIRGEEIVGYMTKNRGLVIHKRGCPSIREEMSPRLRKVAWNENNAHVSLIRLELLIADVPGTLNTITGITMACDSNIKRIEQEQYNQTTAKVKMNMEIRHISQYNKLFQDLKQAKGIFSIQRKKVG